MTGSGKTNQITAYNQHDEAVGYLSWAEKGGSGIRKGEILGLRVRPDHRRQGIASGMFSRSQNFEVGAKHSGSRSPEGSAFAKSTGTSVPKLKRSIPSESHLDISPEALMQMENPGKIGRKLD
jgi:GNAT superfamily N-acetyltransferase